MKCPSDSTMMDLTKVDKGSFYNLCHYQCSKCGYKQSTAVKRYQPPKGGKK